MSSKNNDNNFRKVAIFDFDNTIIEINSTFDFIGHFLWLHSKLKFIIFLFLREFNFLLDFRSYAVSLLKGFKKETISEASKYFFEHSKKYLNKEALEQIQYFKSNGYEIILISATLDFLLKPFADFIKCDSWFASELEFNEEEKCTGHFKKDLLGRKEFLVKTKKEFENINFKKSYCFSDNKEDIEFLKLFGESRAVIYNNWGGKFLKEWWFKNGIKTITFNTYKKFNEKLYFIPFSYSVYSKRFPSLRSFIIQLYLIPQIINFYFLNIPLSFLNIILFFIGLLGFYSIYEIGYAQNDCQAFFEKKGNPIFRCTREFCQKIKVFVFYKISFFVIILVLIYLLDKNLLLFVSLCILTLFLFLLHNFVGGNSKVKIFTFPSLRIMKIITPFSLLSEKFFLASLFYICYILIEQLILYIYNKDIFSINFSEQKIKYFKLYYKIIILTISLVIFLLFSSRVAWYLFLFGFYFIIYDIFKSS